MVLAIGDLRTAEGEFVQSKEAITDPILFEWLDPVEVQHEKVTKSEVKSKLSNVKWRYGPNFSHAISLLAGDVYLELCKAGMKALFEDETAVKWITNAFREKVGIFKFREELTTAFQRDEEVEKSWLKMLKIARVMAKDYDKWIVNEKKPSATT